MVSFPSEIPWRKQASFVNCYPLEIIFHLGMGLVPTYLLGFHLVQIPAGPMHAASFSEFICLSVLLCPEGFSP